MNWTRGREKSVSSEEQPFPSSPASDDDDSVDNTERNEEEETLKGGTCGRWNDVVTHSAQ